MAVVRDISEAASNARQKAGRKLRWPVSEIVIAPSEDEIDISELENVLKGQTNSKKITVLSPGQKPRMDLEMTPHHKNIGPVFKGEAKKVVEAIKSADPIKVKSQLDEGAATLLWEGKSYSIKANMVQFTEIPPQNLSAAEFSRGFVYVDITLTPELLAEGYAREIIRRIQDMRKEMDLRVEDQIKVVVRVDSEEISNLVASQKGYIANEVRASDLEMGRNVEVTGKLTKDWDVEELKLSIGVDKI
jgi:isoleucyl-tRNA synthetase